jgi:hypothetical protein
VKALQKGRFFGSTTRSLAAKFWPKLFGRNRLRVSTVRTAAMQMTKNVAVVMFSAMKRISSDKWLSFIGGPPRHYNEILYAAG